MTTARRRGTCSVSPEDRDDDGLARHHGCCAEVIHLTNLPNHPPWIAARGHLAGYPPQWPAWTITTCSAGEFDACESDPDAPAT